MRQHLWVLLGEEEVPAVLSPAPNPAALGEPGTENTAQLFSS